MNDKSVAMPCGESKAAARASLVKHVIHAKAIKARRCIAFPQRRSTLQSVTILITLQRHSYHITTPRDAMDRRSYSPRRAFRLRTAGRQGERLFHPLLVGQGEAVVESVEPALRPAVEVSCPFPNQIHQAKMLGFAVLHQSRHGVIREPAQTPTKSTKTASTRPK